MALIKFRKGPIRVKVRGILRAVVGIVIGGRVEAFAEGVISEDAEVPAETLLDFGDAALVKSVGLRAVLVVLDNQRIHKAVQRRAGKALGSNQRLRRRA